jgi:hypothetical protein
VYLELSEVVLDVLPNKALQLTARWHISRVIFAGSA